MPLDPRSYGDLFPAPRSEAAIALVRVIDDRQALVTALRDLDREQHDSGTAVAEASDALTALERAARSGETISAKQRTEAEQTLSAARAACSAPWGERRSGLQAALRDHDGRVQFFASEHFDELVDELDEDAEAAAAQVTRVAEAIAGAVAERHRAARRVEGLAQLVFGHTTYGDVALSRADALARAADELLTAGGERGPTLRRDLPRPVEDVA